MPLSDHVIYFARTLSAIDPVVLPFTDVGAGYIPHACHLNVAHRVKHHGGEPVRGWMIWTSIQFTEGEFHSVWRSPEGDLFDVTPRCDGEDTIVFVPDPASKVEPRGNGALLPANRTTIPFMPYAVGGMPSDRFYYREPNDGARMHMMKLGMSHFTGGVTR